MARSTFSITELSGVIHEQHSNAADSVGARFTVSSIVQELLGMAERGELPVSFTNKSDPGVGTVHISLAGTPYESEDVAAQDAEARDDLRGIHYEITPIKGGWGIQDVTAAFDGWFEYWADKENKKDKGGNISGEGFYALGKTMFVSLDDWTAFKEGCVFLDWLDGATLTEEQKQELLPESPKAKPSGLTREKRSKGGRQPKVNLALLEAIRRIIGMLDGGAGTPPPSAAMVWEWLYQNGQSHNHFEFDPVIDGCDYLYVDGDTLNFKDQNGRDYIFKRRALDPYVSKAKSLLKTDE